VICMLWLKNLIRIMYMDASELIWTCNSLEPLLKESGSIHMAKCNGWTSQTDQDQTPLGYSKHWKSYSDDKTNFQKSKMLE